MQMKYALRNLEKVIKLFAKKYVLLVICIVFLLIPFILRFNVMAGEDNYYNIRIAENLIKGIYYDELSYSGRELIPTLGWPVILAIFKTLLNIPYEILVTMLTFLFTALSFLIFYSLIKELDVNIILFSSLFLIISPAFLYLSTISLSVVVFLMLLTIYLLSKDYNKLSLFTFAFIPFFSISGTFVSLIIVFMYTLYIKRSKLFSKFLLVTLLASLIYLPFVYKFGLPERLTFLMHQTGIGFALKRIIFDLGGFGVATFTLLLSFLGFNILWEKKYKNIVPLITFISLIISSYFFDIAIFYLNFLVCFIASYGLINILTRKWYSGIIKKFVILIFVSGLLFSSLSFLNQFNRELPNKDIVDGLKHLKDRDGVVLSNYDRGIWINTLSGNKNVIDSNFYYAPDVNSIFENVQKLFYTRDIEISRWIFDKYNIRYIFIDNFMKNKIWEEDEEGLLFILKYSKEFQKIYSKNGVEIWEYLK